MNLTLLTIAAPLVLSFALSGCADAETKVPRAADSGGGGNVSTDAGSGTRDADTTRPDFGSIDPFEVFDLTIAGTEQGMRLQTVAGGDELECAPGTPAMTLLVEGGAPIEIEASDCFNGDFYFDFVADFPVGAYDLEFRNGDGRTHRPTDFQFTVYESLGMPQQALEPGRNPSLAANWDTSNALIAAVDPADSTLFFLGRTLDFSQPASSTARVSTDIVANEVRIWSTGDSSVGYVAFWASDTEVGVLWLDDDASEVMPAPAPLAVDGAQNLDMVISERGQETAVVWENANGEVEMAILDVGGAEWINGPATAGPGTTPRVTNGAGIFDYMLIYDRAEGEAYTHRFEADRFNDMPLGSAQLVDFDRAMCDYSQVNSRYRVCQSYAIEGRPPSLLVYDGRDFITPENAAPAGQPHPATIVSDPGETTSPDWVFVSYVDDTGGVTHGMWASDSLDGPSPVIARFGQAYDGVPWDVDANRNRQGTFIAWVTEVNGQIELGSIALPDGF